MPDPEEPQVNLPPGSAVLQVPLIAQPVPQIINWQFGSDGGGGENLQLLIQSPMTTTLLTMDQESAKKLRDAIDEKWGAPSGLHIVGEMPKRGSGIPGLPGQPPLRA